MALVRRLREAVPLSTVRKILRQSLLDHDSWIILSQPNQNSSDHATLCGGIVGRGVQIVK